MIDLKQNLEKAGLTKRESLIYLALLKNGSLSPTQISSKTGLKRPNVYDVVKNLEAKGLIHYEFRGGHKTIAASSPNNLLEMSKQQFDFTQKLLPYLLSIDREQSFQSNITFYQGRKGMQELLSDYPKAKSKEVWFILSPKDMNDMVGKDFVESLIKERIRLGTRLRSLRPADTDFKWQGHYTAEGSALTEIAYVPPQYSFSLSIGIYDDKIIFFSSKREGFGFRVESKEVAEIMRILYDNLWKNSGKVTTP